MNDFVWKYIVMKQSVVSRAVFEPWTWEPASVPAFFAAARIAGGDQTSGGVARPPPVHHPSCLSLSPPSRSLFLLSGPP